MEVCFITIHGMSLLPDFVHNTNRYSDLSLDARIKYVSDSVEDILGYLPHEVKGKSCWEYFHPNEIPFARAVHGRGINLDKAASLNYCQIKHKDGSWVGCECVFTVVYDVLVACTSIYQRGPRSRSQYSFRKLVPRN
jgi:PAS domain S-box-containing protein